MGGEGVGGHKEGQIVTWRREREGKVGGEGGFLALKFDGFAVHYPCSSHLDEGAITGDMGVAGEANLRI